MTRSQAGDCPNNSRFEDHHHVGFGLELRVGLLHGIGPTLEEREEIGHGGYGVASTWYRAAVSAVFSS